MPSLRAGPNTKVPYTTHAKLGHSSLCRRASFIAGRALLYTALAGAAGIGAWGISQRLRPSPMPPGLAFLLESRLVAAVVGPEALLERAGIREGLRVLDAGCGPGRLTLPAARRVGSGGGVVAVDAQKEMLEKLAVRLSASGLTNVTLLQAELGSGELAYSVAHPGYQEAFDRVLVAMVTGEIHDRRRAFETLYAATAPGGVLSVTETLEPDYRSKAVISREIEATGFHLERVYGGRLSYTLNFVKPF